MQSDTKDLEKAANDMAQAASRLVEVERIIVSLTQDGVSLTFSHPWHAGWGIPHPPPPPPAQALLWHACHFEQAWLDEPCRESIFQNCWMLQSHTGQLVGLVMKSVESMGCV